MNRLVRLFLLLACLTVVLDLAGCGGSSTSTATLAITPSSLPDGTIGTTYSQSVGVSGGTPPFHWTVTGSLPDNLSLQVNVGSSTVISGVPDEVQSNVAFTMKVTDASGNSASQSYTVNIQGTPTVVQTQYGAVQGIAAGNLYAFRGVPYAAPPVADLRWKVPQPATSWKGVRDATKFGNVCPQIDSAGVYAGDEDCLVLNVFIPQSSSQKLPVVVFLHGGGDVSGDTQFTPTNVDAPPLAAQGVIVVTVEYRLGLLGFLAHPLLTTEGNGSSGHYALADMIFALTWVQQNIAAFGGDPTHVMLFGQSAGSYNIQRLFAVPTAQGLFSAAAMESGVRAPGPVVPFSAAEAAGQQVATALGCSSAADVLGCLRAVPAETIVNLPNIYQFGPGVGSPFLPVDAFTVIAQYGPPVPLLIGSNREEMSLADSPTQQLDDAAYAAAIHQRFDPFGSGVADQVLALYPASAYSSAAYALIIVDTDFNFTCEVRSVARAAAAVNGKPVWRYFYTKAFENDPNEVLYGAFHTAELFFLFGNFNDSQQPGGGLDYTPNQADLTFSQTLMGYWTRLATTGNPNGSGAVAWPLYDPTTDSMLQLDDTSVAINGYNNAQCDYLVTLPQP